MVGDDGECAAVEGADVGDLAHHEVDELHLDPARRRGGDGVVGAVEVGQRVDERPVEGVKCRPIRCLQCQLQLIGDLRQTTVAGEAGTLGQQIGERCPLEGKIGDQCRRHAGGGETLVDGGHAAHDVL